MRNADNFFGFICTASFASCIWLPAVNGQLHLQQLIVTDADLDDGCCDQPLYRVDCETLQRGVSVFWVTSVCVDVAVTNDAAAAAAADDARSSGNIRHGDRSLLSPSSYRDMSATDDDGDDRYAGLAASAMHS